MSGVVGVAVEDDKTFFAPVKDEILGVFVFLGGTAKETTQLFFTQNELLSPRRPEFFQTRLLDNKFSNLHGFNI